MARKENLSGRRTLLRKAASLPRSSGSPHSRGDIHPSDLLRLRRRPIRDPNAGDVEQATLQDGRKQDNSQELPVCPRDNPAAERASIRAEEGPGVVGFQAEKVTLLAAVFSGVSIRQLQASGGAVPAVIQTE